MVNEHVSSQANLDVFILSKSVQQLSLAYAPLRLTQVDIPKLCPCRVVKINYRLEVAKIFSQW